MHTERDVEAAVDRLLAPYAGKETEENWQARDAALDTLRSLLLSAQLAQRFPDIAAAQVKRTVPAILSSVRPVESLLAKRSNGRAHTARGHRPLSTSLQMLSLRTQLAVKAARTACDVMASLGPLLDALSLDQFTATAFKMCQQAKRIVALAGAEVLETAVAVLQTTRPMGTIVAALADKSKDVRLIAANLFLLAMQHCTFSRTVAEGLRDTLQRGLADATPPVRETMRLAYWAWRQHVPAPVADQ